MKKITAQIVRDELKKAKLVDLPKKVDGLSGKFSALSNKVDGLSKKVDTISGRMDQVNDAARIIQENEQNLKDLGGLKHRLVVLDDIFVKVDKIAGEVTTYREQQELNSKTLSDHDDRIERVEKHLNFQPAS